MCGASAASSSTPSRRAPARLVGEGPLEPQERLLALQPASVTDEAAGGADHAVARKDDWDRVAVHDAPDGPSRPRPTRLRGELPVRGHASIRYVRERLEDTAVEMRHPPDVHLELERAPSTREVLVELSPHRVEGRPSAQDAGAESPRELLELGFGLWIVGDAAQPSTRRGDEQRAHRGIGHVVGDVEQPLGCSRFAEPAVELFGNGHREDTPFLRNPRMPDQAGCRAPCSPEPRARPMSAYDKS